LQLSSFSIFLFAESGQRSLLFGGCDSHFTDVSFVSFYFREKGESMEVKILAYMHRGDSTLLEKGRALSRCRNKMENTPPQCILILSIWNGRN
jgi:hypothetical protein